MPTPVLAGISGKGHLNTAGRDVHLFEKQLAITTKI